MARASGWTSEPPTPGCAIHIDDQLTHHSAAQEGEDAGVTVEVRVDDMARHEAPIHRADIAHHPTVSLRSAPCREGDATRPPDALPCV